MSVRTVAFAAMAVLAWNMPASALTVTYTGQPGASLSYMASTDGELYSEFSFTFAPATFDPDPFPDVVVDVVMCGDVKGVGQMCAPSLPPGTSYLSANCSIDDSCAISGSYILASPVLAGGYVSFSVFATSPRSLLTSSITFVGPSAVPLPAAIFLLSAGLVGLGLSSLWNAKKRTC